jgi:hypothetical protein
MIVRPLHSFAIAKNSDAFVADIANALKICALMPVEK